MGETSRTRSLAAVLILLIAMDPPLANGKAKPNPNGNGKAKPNPVEAPEDPVRLVAQRMLGKHLADTAAGCAPEVPLSRGNPNPTLSRNANARELLQAPSVAAAQLRASAACNLTSLALLAGRCCTSQTLAWFEAASLGMLHLNTSSAVQLSFATEVARALGPRRIAFVGDSVLDQLVGALIAELDRADGFERLLSSTLPSAPSAARSANVSRSTARSVNNRTRTKSKGLRLDKAVLGRRLNGGDSGAHPGDSPQHAPLPPPEELCDELHNFAYGAVSCRTASYANGLTIIGLKAYGFQSYNLTADEQRRDSSRMKPGEGRVETRTLAALLAHTDLVLIELCATHMHSMQTYQRSVDLVLGQIKEGVRWAWRSTAGRRTRASRASSPAAAGRAAAAAAATAPHVPSHVPTTHRRPQLASVVFLEDIPQQFDGPPSMGGWFQRKYARSGVGCIPSLTAPHPVYNQTRKITSRAQLLDLPAYFRARLAEAATEAAKPTAPHASPHASPRPWISWDAWLPSSWRSAQGGRKAMQGEPELLKPALSNVKPDLLKPDLLKPDLATVLSPHVVVRVSSWMAPLGFMAKCGGRAGNQMSVGWKCDCTHVCAGSLNFVPWFTALHEAIPLLV